MKKRLLDLFKGFILGVDSTVPGISIATLAILLNIYERLIEDFSNLFKTPWKVIRNNIYLVLGFLVGIVFNVIAITYLLSHFPLPSVMFFLGLVLLSIPAIFKKIDKKNIKIKDIVAFVISLVVIIVLSIINGGISRELDINVWFVLMIFFLALLASSAMVIPGISGSLIIMAFGYYEVILTIFKEFLLIFTGANNYKIWIIVMLCLIFALGVILGIVLCAKLIKYLLNRFTNVLYMAILGLIVGSPFSIIYLTNKTYVIDYSNPYVYVFSAITLVLGIILGIFILKLSHNSESEGIKKEKNID